MREIVSVLALYAPAIVAASFSFTTIHSEAITNRMVVAPQIAAEFVVVPDRNIKDAGSDLVEAERPDDPPLVKLLLKLRAEAIANGMQLMSMDEINRELGRDDAE